MDLNTFNDHLDRLGPELDSWPADGGTDARALLEASAEARDAMADAQTLANLLNAMAEIPAPGYLASRINALANAEASDPWQRLLNWFAGALWRPILAVGLPLAFGFTVGLVQVPVSVDDEYLAAELGLLAFSTSYQEVSYEGQ